MNPTRRAITNNVRLPCAGGARAPGCVCRNHAGRGPVARRVCRSRQARRHHDGNPTRASR